jgi:hypothetical protein
MIPKWLPGLVEIAKIRYRDRSRLRGGYILLRTAPDFRFVTVFNS